MYKISKMYVIILMVIESDTCMSKKEFLILIIVFISVIAISALSIYFIFNKDENPKISNVLKVGDYTLQYGQYKGVEEEYNADTQTLEKKEIILNLSKNKINDEFYEVKGMSLYINGYEMYKVIANDKIKLLAGEGVDFEYERE